MIKISALGHRKRIIASLAERPYEEAPTKSRRLSPIMVRLLMRKTVRPSLFPEIDRLALHQWVHVVPNVTRMMDDFTDIFHMKQEFYIRTNSALNHHVVKKWIRIVLGFFFALAECI